MLALSLSVPDYAHTHNHHAHTSHITHHTHTYTNKICRKFGLDVCTTVVCASICTHIHRHTPHTYTYKKSVGNINSVFAQPLHIQYMHVCMNTSTQVYIFTDKYTHTTTQRHTPHTQIHTHMHTRTHTCTWRACV